jgi:hypothetical protein
VERPKPPVLSKNKSGEPNPIDVILDHHAGAARNCGLRTIERTMKAGAEYVRQLEAYIAYLEQQRASAATRLPTGDYTS